MNEITRNSRKEGVALILVIGMLALLMVLGVAFAIYMRTERVASGAFRNDVWGRQLVTVALNRAIEMANANTTNRYPQWDVLVSPGTDYVGTPMTMGMLSNFPCGGLVANSACATPNGPDSVTLASNAPSVSTGVVVNLRDLSYGLITNVSGQTLYHTALSGGVANVWSAGDGCRILQPAWTNIPTASGGGRVGFVVINCSGLLDVNYAGGASRQMGGSGQEIQLGNLPDVVDTNLLTTYRVKPFETMQELTACGNGLFGRRPTSFVCFSAMPTNSAVVNIGGSASSLINEMVEIKKAFTNSYTGNAEYNSLFTRFLPADADLLYSNLIDYVDDDVIPGNLGDAASSGHPEGPCVEPIWMANEVCVSNVVVFTPTDPSLTNFVVRGTNWTGVEYIFPFMGRSGSQKTKFIPSVTISPVSGSVVTTIAGTRTFSPYAALGIIAGSMIPDYQVKFSPCPMAKDGQTVPSSDIPVAVTTNKFHVNVTISYQSKVVDIVSNIPDISVSMNTTFSGPPNNIYTSRGIASMECLDPRMNYDATKWLSSSASSMGAVNGRTTNQWANPLLARKDRDSLMYVRNGPIQTAGELGYLFLGQEWETVRLVPNGSGPLMGKMHPVLDYFTASQPTNGVYKGIVNVNSKNRDVMTSLIKNMPTGTPTNSPLSDDDVNSLVDYMIARSTTNEFAALSELGTVPFTNYYPAAATNWLDREAFARNLSGLVGVQQRYYLILLYAEATKIAPDGKVSVVVSSKGIAEVWQDPLPLGGPNRTMVRMLQILDE